jgi:hypothetical protein
MSELYGSQTRILEEGTKDTMWMFEALFNCSWPKFMLPKRRFWKTKQRVGRVFSIVASKKVALSRLGRKWHEKVDKKIDNNKSNDLGRKTHEKVTKTTSRVELRTFKSQNHCFCCYRFFLSTIIIRFLPEA